MLSESFILFEISKGYRIAIISGGSGGAEDKIEALKSAGVSIASSPATIGQEMLKVI